MKTKTLTLNTKHKMKNTSRKYHAKNDGAGKVRFATTLLGAAIFLSSFSFEFGTCSAQNVSINTTGAAPNASAGLDIDFTNKGLLIPRVALTITTSNAPIGAGIATSLMVYNTATVNDVIPGYYYWDGTKWVRLSVAGAGGGGFSNMQVFTASGTFTIPAGVIKIMVVVRGGGGGGGSGNGGLGFGQGGSGGGYGKGIFTVVPATVYAVTVGTGGIGAATTTCLTGGAGGATSFGTLISATGGGGGGGCGSTSTPGSSVAALNMTGFVGWQLFLSSPRNEGGACGDGSSVGSGGQGTAFFGNDGKVGNVEVYW